LLRNLISAAIIKVPDDQSENEWTFLNHFGKKCKIVGIVKFKQEGGLGYFFLIEFEDETVIKVS
jgi:hypothetical protein